MGAATIVLAQAINLIFMRFLLRQEVRRRKTTDTRLEKISQFVTAIRYLRYFALEDVWQRTILDARQYELSLRVITSLWMVAISFTNNISSGMFPVVAFWAYVSLAGKALTVDIAFPALQLFSLLETSLREVPRLITVLLNAKVAMQRIEDFMCEPDKDGSAGDEPDILSCPRSDDTVSNTVSLNGKNYRMRLDTASFAWPGISQLVLHNVSITCPVGITLLCGKVGAGKTALLQAMLGELDSRGGQIVRNCGAIAYCSQTPWLQSMSIRENILFFSPYDDSRYKHVIEACALTQDLAALRDGDRSDIGENGVGLSGGQKMRVALARAVYSRAEMLLLDDPLSALDQHTAESIVQSCFAGSLLKDRTVVLVTHRVDVCLGVAEQLVEVMDGKARLVDMQALQFGNTNQPIPRERVILAEANESKDQIQNTGAPKFLEEEHKEQGGVKAAVYWQYIKAGKLKWWFMLIFLLSFHRLIAVGEFWFLKQWGESYEQRSVRWLPSRTGRAPLWISTFKSPFDNLPSPGIDIRPWLYGFSLLAIARAIMFVVSQSFMLVIVYSSGQTMFQEVLYSISRATFRFYDITPLGRLMNRMTSDISTMDGSISQQFQDFAWLGVTWISSIVVIASVTPVFLIFSFTLTAAYVLLFRRFLPTSQSLRRLEASTTAFRYYDCR